MLYLLYIMFSTVNASLYLYFCLFVSVLSCVMIAHIFYFPKQNISGNYYGLHNLKGNFNFNGINYK